MNQLRRLIAGLLTACLLLTVLPPARAADDDSVLTEIGHNDTNTVTLSGSARAATLTVPAAYGSSSVDLVNGLAIDYDHSLYKSVVAVPASAATVDGAAVAVTVSFNLIGDTDGTPKSQTVYQVSVVRAQTMAPTFSGVIERRGKAGGAPLALSVSDFTGHYIQNDGQALGRLVIRGSNLVAGTLAYTLGDVFTTPLNLNAGGAFEGSLTFQGLSYGEVSYYVDAYEKNTLKFVGTAVLTISVYDVPTIKGNFSDTVYKGSSLSFAKSDFSGLCDLRGDSFLSLEVTPAATAYGTWYLDDSVLSAGSPVVISAADIGNLSFQALGAGSASFQFRVANAAGLSEDYGTGSISVTDSALSSSSYYASSKITRGNTWTISTSHFQHSPASIPITYLKISSIPASADGYLCLTTALAKSTEYGYPAISANKALTAGAIIPYDYLRYLRLVTKSAGTGSSVSFTWAITADSSAASANWSADASYTVHFTGGGTVSYETDMDIPIALDASDFSQALSAESGYSLSYVTFTLPAKTSGTLYCDYDPTTGKGATVSSSAKYYTGASPNLSHLTFVPASGYTGTVTIAYKAYRSGDSFLNGTLTIRVSNSAGGIVRYTTDKNAEAHLDAADFSKTFLDATGKTLSYVKFTLPSTSYGKLYYNYTSSSDYEGTVSASEKYYVYSSKYLSYVSFVPHEDYTGTVTVSFRGYTSDGSSYSGKLFLFVVDSPAGIVSYATKINSPVTLSGDDFADEFISVTGSVLSYVVFTQPASSLGTLYYQYDDSTEKPSGTKVTSSAKYYNGSSPELSDLAFVPAKDYAGRVEIKYTIYTAAGTAYVGKLKITVGGTGSGSVSYSTDPGTPVSLRASDFMSKFYSSTGGATLTCVSFSLPSSSYGKLYYGYVSSSNYGAAVSSGTLYYTGAYPYLSNITFVPRSGYSGAFSISYIGYDATGTDYAGKLTITVGSAAGSVNYTTDTGKEVDFVTSDFREALEEETGESLYYVKFSLPSSSVGTLYYDYTSSSSYTSKVSSTTRYYASASPYLYRVTFVPHAGFSGTAAIDYTAYTSDGDSFDGTVVITVSGSSGGSVDYETEKGTPVLLDSGDFGDAFLNATGSTLSYVKFTPPSASSGRLYHSYKASSGTGTSVSSSTKYYRSSSPKISDVTFVPASSFTGTLTIAYTGYTSSGKSYTGALNITVNGRNAQQFTDVDTGYSWASDAISYLAEENIVQGSGSGQFYPGNSISRADFILMVCRAFELETAAASSFSDVDTGSYYAGAVAAAKALGIVQGSNGRFNPQASLSRQDAAVILLRTLEVTGNPPSSASSSYLSVFSDAGSTADYAAAALAALVRDGVFTGSSGKLNPRGNITRAEMAVILYRVLTR